MTVLDSRGIVHADRDGLNPVKARAGRPHQRLGPARRRRARRSRARTCSSGLSGSTVAEDLIATMAPEGIVFALSNPDPEIHPAVAARHAAVVATGRSDFPNQINNVLAFPGVFRGALDAGARRITENMKLAAADAIFQVAADELAVDRIVPSPLDPRVVGRGGARGRRGRCGGWSSVIADADPLPGRSAFFIRRQDIGGDGCEFWGGRDTVAGVRCSPGACRDRHAPGAL